MPITHIASPGGTPAPAEQQGDQTLVWKDVLHEGYFPPSQKFRGDGEQKHGFTVTTGLGKSSPQDRVISLDDLESAFEKRAVPHVAVPCPSKPGQGHLFSARDNTGEVIAVRTVDKDGRKTLQAGIGFTEPEIGAKVRRGTIPNVSCGIAWDVENHVSGETYPAALDHVLLTRSPWVSDLEAFPKVLCADGDETEAEVFEQDEKPAATEEKPQEPQRPWRSESGLLHRVREHLRRYSGEDRPSYHVEDVTADSALVVEEWHGVKTVYVLPLVDGTPVSPAGWTELAEDDLPDELRELREPEEEAEPGADLPPEPQVAAPAPAVVLSTETTTRDRLRAARENRRRVLLSDND
jgi:hypothetical protein